MPSEIPPSGSVACLRTPAREVRVRPSHPLREAARDPLDLRLERLVDSSSTPATRATSSIVRSSCVGPRPPETRQTSAVERLAERRLELGGVVADDRDPGGLQPQPERLLRVERAVQIAPLAPYQFAARHDDGCAGARQELGAIVRCPLAGTLTRTPATFTTTLRGEAT